MNEEMSGEEKSMVVPKNDNRNESDIELLQRMRDRISNHFKIAQELIENDNSTKENPNEKKKKQTKNLYLKKGKRHIRKKLKKKQKLQLLAKYN